MADSAQWGMDKQEILDRLEALKLKQLDLAAYMNIKQSQMSKMLNPRGKRKLRSDEVGLIQKFLQEREGRHAYTHVPSSVSSPGNAITVSMVTDRSQGIPVYRTALGGTGAGGDFTMNAGEIALRVHRPAKFLTRTDIYGIYVRGNAMFPKYVNGELVLVETNKAPRDDEYVAILFKPDAEGGDVGVSVRLLIGWNDDGSVRVRQYSPDKTYDIPAFDIVDVVRILTIQDLVE